MKRTKRRTKLVKMSNSRCNDCGRTFPDVVFDFIISKRRSLLLTPVLWIGLGRKLRKSGISA